jgi:hypothetical protein
MLGSRQQTWIVVDIGGRWIKCARYKIQGGNVHESGAQVIDIQAEGLLSAEEVGVAIGRVLRSAGEHPVAVVLPQSSAVSQVIDLSELSLGDRAGALEKEIVDLTGLSAERCVYDNHPLVPFGSYASPQWTTVAKEENLIRHISPLLGQGLRVEAATTGGNALVAAFRQAHPGVTDTCLVDIGATQTTVVRLKRGEPVQMTSLVGGGENWAEALLESSKEAFEEVEARLFRDNLFVDPVLGPVLLAAVGAWRDRVVRQIEEWRDEFGMPEDDGIGSGGIYLCGGYSAVRELDAALAQVEGVTWTILKRSGEASAPVWLPAHGAALMAAGSSGLQASILPHSLAKMRQRRLGLSRLKTGVLYLFLLVVVGLAAANFKQQSRVEALVVANQQGKEVLTEIQASTELLEHRDKLATRIEPIVRGELNSLASLETFRRIQQVYRDFEFTLIRFADRRTYFRGMDGNSDLDEATESDPAELAPSRRAYSEPQAFVVELTVRGDQAERLQALSDIVGRLREEKYFANVDRLVGESSAAKNALSAEDEAYALLLTLAEQPLPAVAGEKEGTAR